MILLNKEGDMKDLKPAKGQHDLKCTASKCPDNRKRISHAYCVKCPYAAIDILDLGGKVVYSFTQLPDRATNRKGKTKKKTK